MVLLVDYGLLSRMHLVEMAAPPILIAEVVQPSAKMQSKPPQTHQFEHVCTVAFCNRSCWSLFALSLLARILILPRLCNVILSSVTIQCVHHHKCGREERYWEIFIRLSVVTSRLRSAVAIYERQDIKVHIDEFEKKNGILLLCGIRYYETIFGDCICTNHLELFDSSFVSRCLRL